jgi:uncharacterized protein (TIGR00369 family)
MTEYEARDPDFERRVRESFTAQAFMAHIGAEMIGLAPGFCELRLPFAAALTQQDDYFHGGAIGTIADVAGGYAAHSLMGPDDRVLTVEYKLNIVAPGRGRALLARGQVVRPGRTLTTTRADVLAETDDGEVLIAVAQQTLMRLDGAEAGGAR